MSTPFLAMRTATSSPARWRLPLLTAHIVVAVGAAGGALVLSTLGVAGLRGADPSTVYPAAHLVEAWVIAPLAVATLGTGLLQVALTRARVRDRWVTIKLTITAVLTAVVFLVLEPALAATADAATGLAAGSVTDAQRLRAALFPTVAFALLVVNVVLGLSKPTGRSRTAQAAQPVPNASDR